MACFNLTCYDGMVSVDGGEGLALCPECNARYNPCKDCDGSGKKAYKITFSNLQIKCKSCNGTGKQKVTA